MVDKKIIQKAFDNILIKCSYKTTNEKNGAYREHEYTKPEARRKLKEYTQEEIDTLITDFLNPLELKHYTDLKEYHRYFTEKLASTEEGSYLIGVCNDRLKSIDNEIFDYERRIVEGYHLSNNPVPNVDMDDFKKDDNGDRYGTSNTLGHIEKNQIDSENYDVDSRKAKDLHYYFGNGYEPINKSIYNRNYYRTHSNASLEGRKYDDIKESMDKVIGSSNGLVVDTVLYRRGRWDIHLNVGDKFNLKGYVSTSFLEEPTHKFGGIGVTSMDIVILAPKGTKGVCGNSEYEGETLSYHAVEHEYLLGRNTSGRIVNYDYENNKVYVVLE